MPSWSDRLNAASDQGLSDLLSLAGAGERWFARLPASSSAILEARDALKGIAGTEGQTVRQWLDEVAEASPPLARLMEVKRAAKELLRSTAGEDVRTAAILVYHAAVAAAYARHDAVISSRPAGARLGLYDALATALAGHPIALVFRAAVERYLGR